MFLEKPSCLLRTGKAKGFERRWRPLPGKFKNRGPRHQSAGSEQWTPTAVGGGSGDLRGPRPPGRAASPLGTNRRGVRSTRRGQRAASAGARGGGGGGSLLPQKAREQPLSAPQDAPPPAAGSGTPGADTGRRAGRAGEAAATNAGGWAAGPGPSARFAPTGSRRWPPGRAGPRAVLGGRPRAPEAPFHKPWVSATAAM